MLCAEVTHKILRTDTVYDFLNDLYSRNQRSFTSDAVKALVGEIVLTRYAHWMCSINFCVQVGVKVGVPATLYI